jgi:hypothetical protein
VSRAASLANGLRYSGNMRKDGTYARGNNITYIIARYNNARYVIPHEDRDACGTL